MNLLYPLGLLGLIGVPILIIIYIIKNKYTEKTIATTYIWTVSERFLKRKRPVSQLVGLISLILQIIAVVFISVAIAHPVIVEKGKAHEYCFILDASGSMNMQNDGVSRFESGKQEIESIIKESLDGSFYTLISVDNGANLEYRKLNDKEKALEKLKGVSVSAVDMNTDLAMQTAQEIFDENKGVKTYLVTDKEYDQTENVDVINVAKTGVNYSLISLASKKVTVAEEERVHFTGELSASGLADGELKEVSLSLYIDDVLVKTDVKVGVKTGENAEFTLETEVTDFTKAKLVLADKDNLALDNEFILYDIEKENERKTLLVTKENFALASFVEAINVKPTIVSPENYNNSYSSGYDLYIFDAFSPDKMPTDGAVWFFAPPENIAGAGFAVQGKVNINPHATLDITTNSSSQVQKLVENISNRERIAVTNFIQYGTYRNFTTLYSYKSIPMIFTGVASSGYREVVFSFDLHDSNFAMLYDGPVLLTNLWKFSFPDVVEKVVYESGEEIQINALPGCSSIRVDAPNGEATYLDIAGGASIFTPNQAGEYLITMKVGDNVKTYNIYSILPQSEREVTQTATVFSLNGEATDGGLDGIKDTIILIAFIVLALAFVADWMVYCYDKYQLR